jgi:hypothetical protein
MASCRDDFCGSTLRVISQGRPFQKASMPRFLEKLKKAQLSAQFAVQYLLFSTKNDKKWCKLDAIPFWII